jgi:hypothetical protein
MIRECWEETGISTEARGLEWQHFATLLGENYHMEIFALFSQTIFYASCVRQCVQKPWHPSQ